MRIVVVGGGISGLATGLALKDRAEAQGRPLELTVLESSSRVGGTVGAMREAGFLCETGPNGYLDSRMEIVALVERLGLADRLLVSSDDARRRFVLVDGALQAIPTGPKAFMTSPLLSVGGRIRVATEPWRRRGPGGDESVATFARRRLGPQATERLIDPFVSGVFAGDVETLSVGAAFPKLVELETRYGSLIKAQKALARERKARGEPPPEGGPGGRLTSFVGGASDLTDRLAELLGDAVRCDRPVEDLRRVDGGWRVAAGDLEIAGADAVVLAIPAHAGALLAGTFDADIGRLLGEIPYAAVSVVCLGFPRDAVDHDLRGFGFLVPSSEGRSILGCLWTSSIYPGARAPEGQVLLRVMVGGARHPELALLEDDAIVALCRSELDALLGLHGEPTLARVARWPSAIPQYELGHLDRLAALGQALARWPGLHLTGNAFRGISLNDCVREGARVAERILPDPA